MANLNGQNIGFNYQGILNLETINTPLSATVQSVSDGTGQNSPLKLGTNSVRITGGNLFADSNLFNAGFIETGRLISTTTATASTPPVSITGGWFSGGSATTTKPQLLIEPTGTTSTAWSTSGTGLGINAASSFTGNLIDSQINGASKFSIDINGNVAANIIYNRGISFRDTGAFMASDANNQIKVYNPGASAGDPMFLQIGGNTATYPALKRNNTNIEIKLATDSAYTGLNTGILSVLNAGVSGTPTVSVTGAWFVGNTPQFLIQSSATSNPSWSSNGTGLGINATNGLATTANIIATFANGTAAFRTQFDGDVLLGGGGARIRPSVATATTQATSISGQGLSVYGSNLVGPGHQFIVFTNGFTAPSGNDNGALKLVTSFTPSANGSAGFNPLNIAYTINAGATTQTGTMAGIYLRATETALGSATHNLIDLALNTSTNPVFAVSSTGIPTITQSLTTSVGSLSTNYLTIKVGATTYKIPLYNN